MVWSSPSLILERGTEGVSYENHKYLQYFSGIIVHVYIISCLTNWITDLYYISAENKYYEHAKKQGIT